MVSAAEDVSDVAEALPPADDEVVDEPQAERPTTVSTDARITAKVLFFINNLLKIKNIKQKNLPLTEGLILK